LRKGKHKIVTVTEEEMSGMEYNEIHQELVARGS
jgi:hypothetical protein